jgi:hypothetical protein
MSTQNPKLEMRNRKGVYQAFDANGNVTADERWQFIRTLDGGIRVDNETARILPFQEPRNESLMFELSSNLELRLLTIRALDNRRESRASFSPERLDICWRLDERSRNRELTWRIDCEIDYNSPLFNMVTLWRSGLLPGRSRAFDAVLLDDVTFEPRWIRQIYTYVGDEQRETRFGNMVLTHYALDFGGDGSQVSHFWCDRGGVVFDFASSYGGGFRLVAVNFPG